MSNESETCFVDLIKNSTLFASVVRAMIREEVRRQFNREWPLFLAGVGLGFLLLLCFHGCHSSDEPAPNAPADSYAAAWDRAEAEDALPDNIDWEPGLDD